MARSKGERIGKMEPAGDRAAEDARRFRAPFRRRLTMLAGMPSPRHRTRVAWLGPMLILAWSVRASAKDPKAIAQPVAVDLNRLGAELDLFAAEARRARLASALTGLCIGSALLPAGLVLLGR